jgi:hypothetical protein
LITDFVDCRHEIKEMGAGFAKPGYQFRIRIIRNDDREVIDVRSRNATFWLHGGQKSRQTVRSALGDSIMTG